MDHYILKYLSIWIFVIQFKYYYNLKHKQFLNYKYHRTILGFFFIRLFLFSNACILKNKVQIMNTKYLINIKCNMIIFLKKIIGYLYVIYFFVLTIWTINKNIPIQAQ